MATIKQVAHKAGVSTCTVSNVLNNKRRVRADTRARVEQAAAELHYTPSGIARSLKINRTLTLGMVVTTSTNPFYSEVLQAVEQRCYELGYSLIIANTRGNAGRLQAAITTLRSRQVDGIILMCTEVDPAVHLDPRALDGLPIVVADWAISDMLADVIRENGRLGGYLATRHLLDQGHRHLGMLTGPRGKRTAEDRYQGFLAALQEAGLEVPGHNWTIEGDFELLGGYDAARALLRAQTLPTAVVAGNDMMAIGALRAFHEAGLKIPDDMALIGYDNIELSAHLVPALSTIEQPKAQLGSAAVDLLLERIKRPGGACQTVHLEPELVVRESTAR